MTEQAIVLTSPPGASALNAGAVDAFALGIGAVINWLAPHEAAHIVLRPDADVAETIADARDRFSGNPVDVNAITPVANLGLRRRLLVADMESTIIEQECLDELADYAGVRERIAGITERAMRGELDFEAALRERVGLLAGLDARILQEIYDERVTLMAGAATLIATMQANGATCALVSGGFSFYTERIAARLGFDTQQANTLDVADDKISGTVAAPILGREAKRAALERLAGEKLIDLAATLAVGDGANDLDMLAAAGLGVAFRAKPIVADKAAVSVVHGDLTALLYLQGYRREEFIL
ncbi:MAG: phosphoserine phosphatase SerB [Hyphomicrobiaceae bacterium]|nr:phosphoserine phosphatase SerB [Hyphomicrobiaceae bacterium]